MAKDAKDERFTWTWRCETCGLVGALEMPRHIGGYEGATAVLDAHRAASPQCLGGVDTVRVGELVGRETRRLAPRAQLRKVVG